MGHETKARILIVDDEPHICEILSRWLTADGYHCATAFDGRGALRLLEAREFQLVISDIIMPRMSGVDLLHAIVAQYPATAVLMVTAVDDRKTATLCLEIGASGYIIKPFERNEILINVSSALERRDVALLSQEYDRNMQEHLRRHNRELECHEEIVLRMIAAVGQRYGETHGHLTRVGLYATVLAEAAGVGMTLRELEDIGRAAAMHDVGMIGIPDRVLLKPERLTKEEFSEIMKHTELGRRMLQGSDSPVLRMAREIALCHHERWDGTGYPHGLAGEAIPQSARIVAIADAYDSLVHPRLYRPAVPEAKALSLMANERGKQFDPRLLDRFFEIIPEIRSIKEKASDEARNGHLSGLVQGMWPTAAPPPGLH
ncbi:MAG: response regulator [Desulfomonile tiedjei]|nr:response regulator [Desulfomonile tiedjei]